MFCLSTTAALVEELEGTNVQLVDTRKTTPGLRLFEKYAFRCGGGVNHRLGLDDAAMLKENHIAWSGGVAAAVHSVRSAAPWTTRIIVEVETPAQAEEAVKCGADGVLLDEFSPELLEKVVPSLRKLAVTNQERDHQKQIVFEASGVDPNLLKRYAVTGVDIISTSVATTRSKWLDFSMRYDNSVEGV